MPDAGFTLIELLLVMALLVMLTVLAIPTLDGSDSIKLRMAAEAIANELRLGLSLAHAHGQTIRITFNIATQSVDLAYDTPPRLPLKVPYYLPEGILFERIYNEYLICNPLGGFAQGLSTPNGYTTILTQQRTRERYYIIASVFSERVRTSSLPP
ncbi:MAG: prepilin-type N-terminal cleavage/methylation domain-containing protein [Symbiobacteriaceae bacterium]|nr:prepilin-type N-terminal cleavage/methylation domain-containing protein [Symbiobacteriaceae bacterium]